MARQIRRSEKCLARSGRTNEKGSTIDILPIKRACFPIVQVLSQCRNPRAHRRKTWQIAKVAEPGTYRSPTGPNGKHETFDEDRARQVAEAAAREAAAQAVATDQRFAALERRFKARLDEVTEAVTLAFGDLRGEMDDRFREAQTDFSSFLKESRALIRQSRSEASERRTQMAAIQRDHERLALEVEKLKLEFSEEHGKGKSLRIAK
ncbi:hypothetical protein GHK46_26535 [Sinorhizobium medicae]|uniref:hypothetical protein n=1 Tax=Sinorhizobium medicae TaxID=110321 RepID=UPI0012963B0C|nr:hypothetical protein [Sinorhizobium medicae]MQW00746.1 hypothetical protein [Sinorhizobium medicae]